MNQPVTDTDPDFARLIVDSATDFAIFTVDAGGILTSWNIGAETILGWNADEAIGQSGKWFSPPRIVKLTHLRTR
jgi:PAS domain S-box-containing protein